MGFKNGKALVSLRALCIGAITLLTLADPVHGYTTSVYEDCVRGNNVRKTVERELPAFNILEISGAFKINIRSTQTKQTVKISGDENILPHIATTTSGNKLLIHSTKPICTQMGISLDISVGNLYALVSSGSDNVKVHEIYADRFSLVLEGAGDIELTGYTRKFDADISGSGDLETRGLKTEETTLNISGTSNANVHAAQILTVNIVGVADVYYTGDPGQVYKDILGAGTLNKIE
ncbi:MAG: DUF2807 domain-containing protein [Desulfobulbales bacterium]|nr:DUF2807 domain-containing protein [Desulfobulbales bacterium]